MARVDILQGPTMQEVQWKGKEHNCADSCLGDVLVPWPTAWVQLGECVCWIQLSGYQRSFSMKRSTEQSWKDQKNGVERIWVESSTVFYRHKLKSQDRVYVKIYTSLTDFFYIWAWLIVTLWWGQNYICLAGWEPFPPRFPSAKCTLRAPVSSLGVWSLYLHRCTSEGTTWFHLGQQPFSLVTSWLHKTSNCATIMLKIKIAMVTNGQHY